MAFFYSQLFVSLPYPTGDYSGKTIVITGSNVGLGKEAARHYVRMGASKLILAVRNSEKGEQAKLDIQSSTGCSEAVLDVWKVDMSSYDSVLQFAERVNAELERCDIFIANAGIAPGKYAVLEDNEASITVNVVSTLLLAAAIMPKLESTASKFGTRPTLTIVSSDVHGHTTVPQKSAEDGQILKTINDKKTAEKYWSEQYPVSKLLEVFAVRSIASLYSASESKVTINCVNPGLCHSELGRDFNTVAFWLIKTVLARSTEAGSRTLVHAGSQGVESHGQYLSDCGIVQPAAFVTSTEGQGIQARVWKELVDKLNSIKPGVISNL